MRTNAPQSSSDTTCGNSGQRFSIPGNRPATDSNASRIDRRRRSQPDRRRITLRPPSAARSSSNGNRDSGISSSAASFPASAASTTPQGPSPPTTAATAHGNIANRRNAARRGSRPASHNSPSPVSSDRSPSAGSVA